MSITLPPLPLPDCGESYMYEGQSMHLYALAAVELYIASRAPMTARQRNKLIAEWSNNPTETAHELIRHVEAHHGIGAKP